MTEIELKASLAGIERTAAEQAAAALGFRPDYTCREEDIYYNGVGRNFQETDEALRLRRHTEGGITRSLVTYKGAKQDVVSQTRLELESGVENGEAVREILEKLGYPAVLTVRKARQGFAGTGEYAGVNLCFDTVEGLGDYLELEFPAPDGIGAAERARILDTLLALLDRLGVPRNKLGRESYLELLQKRVIPRRR